MVEGEGHEIVRFLRASERRTENDKNPKLYEF
jgi:hypothetical protein